MELAYNVAEEEFRDHLRGYFAAMMTPEVLQDLELQADSTLYRPLIRKLGQDGLLGLAWPRSVGGHGRTVTEQFILYDEILRAGAPFPFHGVNTVGPTLIRYGSSEQQARFLPKIVSGELHFAVGYTEAEAGTDLASLTTKAERKNDEYVINGAKLYTSGAFHSDYIWLACRTNRQVSKHKGISLILVPTNAEGFTWSPINTVGDHMTCATYYDNVRVPVENLVGDEGDGWRLMTTQLNHERVSMAARGALVEQAFDDVLDWARLTPIPAGGDRLIDVAWVQRDLAQCRAMVDAMRLLNWKTACSAASESLTPEQSSTTKVFGVDVSIEAYRLMLGVLGARGPVRPGNPGAALRGRIEVAARFAQTSTFTGGIQEIQREIIATAGLGMPRVPR